MAVCGMECVNLKNNMIKILGVHFSCNRSLEKLLKLERIQELTVEGKILIFKTLAKTTSTSCFREECIIQYNCSKNIKKNYLEKQKS